MPIPTQINDVLVSGLASLITAVIGLIVRAIEKPYVIKKAIQESQPQPTENNANNDSQP